MQRKFPQVKFGYEWSGLELEQLKEDAPDVFDEMLDLVKSGQSTFYNGTYSQPHLQTLSSEANYRQFEWGARIYRQLCNNHQVIAYAHQESSINDQTPQLLKALGLLMALFHAFIQTWPSWMVGSFTTNRVLARCLLTGKNLASGGALTERKEIYFY